MPHRFPLSAAWPVVAFCLGLIAAQAAVVPTIASAAGASLRWDNCYSDGGVANKTFACDTNTGSERLVMSFVLGAPFPSVSGIESRVFIVSASTPFPSWWQFKNVGSCRLTALSMTTAVPPGSVNCADWANGNASGGIGSYSTNSELGPNGAVLSLAEAVPPSGLLTLDAGPEYLSSSLVISHAKTVGAGACAGCDQPVCIVLDYLNITTPVLANNMTLRDPAFVPDGNFARWQNGQETNVQVLCLGQNFGCFHSYACELSSTPTRLSTWGAVKALYR